MRRSSRLPVLAWLAWAVLALASAGFARGTGAPVRLLAPQAGATLAAGSTAELEWAPGSGLASFPAVEEWEAFLSLDGGATYPVRITPHLDQDLRRVRFQVPPIPTPDARILLRFGDERRETYLRLPQRFSIAVAPGMERTFTLAALGSQAPAAGEPALPGHPGVVAWMEGSRRGGAVRLRVAPERPSWRRSFSLPGGHARTAALLPEEAPANPLAPRADGTGVALASTDPIRPSRFTRDPRFTIDVLLLTQRQNE